MPWPSNNNMPWSLGHVKSDYARTIIQHSPLDPWYYSLAPRYQKLQTVYSLPQQHHVDSLSSSRGEYIVTRAREGGPKAQIIDPNRNSRVGPVIYIYGLLLFTPPYLSCIVVQPPSLLPKATFTPSNEPSLVLQRTLNPITSVPSSHTELNLSLHVYKTSQFYLIHSSCQLPYYSRSTWHLFIRNSTNSCHSQ